MNTTIRRFGALLGAAGLLSATALFNTPATATAQPNPIADALPLDELGRPTPEVLDQARHFAEQPWLPDEFRSAILAAVAFFAGEGNGGPPLPEDAPHFTQFAWPTVAGNCIGGESDSVGSAIAVPGPAEIPVPGAEAGQTAFLFTGLGTAPAAEQQGGMHVHWININNLRTGITALDNHGINPDGPATLSGTADTGRGTVLAMVTGEVYTEDATCSYIPTGAIVEVR